MLAGNVIAALSGGNLRVKGDALDNEIRIGITAGDLVVEGLNGTTINGQAAPFVAVAGSDTIPRNLVVSLKQGNDSLLVEGIKVTHRATIYGNGGSDLIEVRGDSEFTNKLAIVGGAADDVIFVHDNTTPIEGRVNIRGKKAGDTIGLENNVFNGPVNVTGNASDDSIAAFSNTFNGTYRADGGGRVDRYGEDAGGNTFNDNRRVERFEEVDGALTPPIQNFLPELPPTIDISVAVSPSSVDEDGATNLDFTFTRTGDTTGALTVDFSVGGAAGFNTDYTQTGADTFTATTGSVTFAAGSATAVVTVDPTADTTVEADESVILTVVNGAGYSVGTPSSATGTITNDDTATLTIANVTQNEGTGGTTTDFMFTVTLDNAVAGGFDLAFTTNDDTATTADNDYIDNDGTVNFAGTAGENQTITVQVNHDAKVEADELFNVALGALSNLGAGVDSADITTSGSPATGTITNDDMATLSIAGVTSAEGTGGTTTDFTFNVTLNNPVQGGLDVAFTTNDDTATVADNDYVDNDGTLSFAGNAGEIQPITVQVSHDAKVEADELFNVALGALSNLGAGIDSADITTTGSPATGTITNDDTATLTLTGVAATQDEGTGGTTTDFTFSVALNNPVQGGFDVAFTTNDDTATVADSDYIDNDGTLTFAGNAAEIQQITVQVNHDAKVEADELFNVALGALSNLGAGIDSADISTLGSPSTGTITNDDTATLTLAPVNATQDEGTGGAPTEFTFSVTLDNDVQGGFDVPYTTNDNTATVADNDYTDNDSTLTFAGTLGEIQMITVEVIQDTNVENDEVFNVALGALSNFGSAIDPADITVTGTPTDGTINNDDLAMISIDDGTLNEGDSGTTTFSFTVSIDHAAGEDITVVANTNPVTATGGGTDYSDIVNQTVTIPAGNTSVMLTVDVTGELLVENDETFEVNLTDPRFNGATDATRVIIGDAQGIGTITNDDLATISISNPSVTEGGMLAFDISIDNPVDADVTADRETADGTATTADSDYTALASSNVTLFSAGSTANFTVNVDTTPDGKVEADEMLDLVLSNLAASGLNIEFSGGGATLTGTGTITNDDTATVTLAPVAASQNEGTGGTTTDFTFSVTLDNDVQGGFDIDFTTNDGTATTGDNDYVDNDGTLTFVGNAAESQTITVQVNHDSTVEADETFSVALGSVSNVGAGIDIIDILTAGTPMDGTIVNDDAATITIDDVTMLEGSSPPGTTSFVFTVTLDNNVQGGFDIAYTTNDGSGGNPATTADNDYQDNDSSLNFLGTLNETQMITVLVNQDTDPELDETFDVLLGSLSMIDATASDDITIQLTPGIGTITNDD